MKTFFFYLFLFFSITCIFMVWALYPTKSLLPPSKDEKPNIYMFLSPSCAEYIPFKRAFYPKIVNKYKDKVHFINIDSDSMKGHDTLVKTVKQCYAKVAPSLLLVMDNTCLQGTRKILSSYSISINKMLFKHKVKRKIKRIFSKD